MKIVKSLLITACCMLSIIFAGCENENTLSLSTPEGLSVENGVISFNMVENADYYSISVNDNKPKL